MDWLEEELAEGLKKAGRDNIALEQGTDEEKRDKSMENIAHPIAEAIRKGEVSLKKVSCDELNAIEDKDDRILYLMSDSGTLAGEPPLSVSAGDIVRWDSGKWTLLAGGGDTPSPADVYSKAETDSRINSAVGAEASRASSREGSLAIAISSIRASVGGLYNSEVEGVADETSVTSSTSGRVKTFVVGLATSIKNKVNAAYAHIANMVNTLDDSATHYPTTHAVTAAIGAEATARESADSALDARIDGEETAREQADGELQAQIDAISSKSDVVDVVASYAELVAYDTSALGDNDVIKVLEDETHDDAESYYRWNLTTQTWGYIGSQGPFVTPAEMQTALNGKVDKVAGKGLSTNDYTTAEKNKLAGIETGANKTVVDTALSGTSTNPVQNKVVKAALDGKIKKEAIDLRGMSFGSSALKNLSIPVDLYDGFWSLDKRFNVHVIRKNGSTEEDLSSSISHLIFDGSNEHSNIVIGDNEQLIVRVTNNDNIINIGTHIYGYFVVGFYNNRLPASVKLEMLCRGATQTYTWSTRSCTHYGYGTSDVWVCSNLQQVYNCKELKFTIDGISNEGARNTSVPTIRFIETRTGDDFAPFLNKYKPQTLYHDIKAPHFIGKLTGEFTTARNLKVNLASESAQPFDGSANAENIGVSGALPDAHIASASTWNGKYTKPSGGIPKTDLASTVQTSLGLADTAVQDSDYVHTDNNYTDGDAEKLSGIEAGAQVNNIFVAVYSGLHEHAGNTPYADIYAAYQAGKRLMCWNGDGNARRLYTLNGFNATDKVFKFTSCGGSGEDILEVSFEYKEGNINDTECWTINHPLAKRYHASTTTDYGKGTSSNYGHVKLSDSTSSTSGVNDGVAATPSAVKAAYDLADGKVDKVSGKGLSTNDYTDAEKDKLDGVKDALDGKVDKTTTVNGHALSGNVTVSKSDLGFGNFIPGAKTGLYGLELSTNEVVDIALSDKVYDTTLFVEYCRSSSDSDGHHPELLAISFRYDTSEANKWVSTPRMAVLYSFNAADNYFKPELRYTADGHVLLNLSATRRHTGQVTIIASSANCSYISVSNLAMWSSVWTGATVATDVRVNAIDDAVVHKEGSETITGVKTVSTSNKVGFIVQDDKDAQLRAQQTGVTNRYVQLDVESEGSNPHVGVYARNGNSNGSFVVDLDSSSVNPSGRGVTGLGQSTDTVVRLGSKKLDFSGTLGTDSNTLYFV